LCISGTEEHAASIFRIELFQGSEITIKYNNAGICGALVKTCAVLGLQQLFHDSDYDENKSN
jgi:hypothetical protein